MTALGVLFGLIFGTISGLGLIVLIFPGMISAIVLILHAQVAAALISVLPSGLGFVPALLLWYGFNILVFWVLCIPVQAQFVSYSGANPAPATGLQNLYRGFGYGTAGSINIALLSPFFGVPGVVFLATISMAPLLAVSPPVRRSPIFQGIVTWMAWVQPVHWAYNALGFILFLIFRAATLGGGGVPIRLDLTSGVIESAAPNPVTAFNVAMFTYIGPADTGNVGGFLGPNLSSHEVGHAVNSAAMTPFYTIGTVMEEFRVFGAPHPNSIGQMAAESRGAARPGALYSAIWSV